MRKIKDKKCLFCNKKFTPKSSNSKYCCTECGKGASRLRKRKKQNTEEQKEMQVPEGMIKTDRKLCKKCKYHTFISDIGIYCWYYMITNKHRGCPVGYCNKFERGKR